MSSLTAPFVVDAVSSSSGTLVSCEDVITASTTNYINVTPWTTAICAMLSSTGMAKDLDPITDKNKILSSLTIVDNYTKVLLAPSLVAAGYAATQGPISTPLWQMAQATIQFMTTSLSAKRQRMQFSWLIRPHLLARRIKSAAAYSIQILELRQPRIRTFADLI